MPFTAQWGNNFENTSAADGTAMTAALSGVGTNSEAPGGTNNAYSAAPTVGSGNASAFTTSSVTGTRSHRFTQASVNRNFAPVYLSATKTDDAVRYTFKYGATPGSNMAVLRSFVDTAAGASSICFNFYVNTGNKIYIGDGYTGNGNTTGTSSQSSGALTPGSKYVAVIRYDPSQNLVTYNVYPLGGTTPAASISMSVPVARPVGSYNFGQNNSTNAGTTVDVDDVLIGTGGAAPRNDIVNAAPTVALSGSASRAVLVGSTVSDLGFTATDSDGTISAFTAAVTAKPAGAATPSLTGSPSGVGTGSASLTVSASFGTVGTYQVTATATDSASAPGSASYVVDAYPPPNTNTTLRYVDPQGYQQLGGVADPIVALSDGDTSTGLESPPSPAGSFVWVQSGPVGPTGISIRVAGPINGSGTLTRKVELYKGDKTTKVWETSLTFTTATAPQVVAVTSAALQNIATPTSRVALWWKITDTIA